MGIKPTKNEGGRVFVFKCCPLCLGQPRLPCKHHPSNANQDEGYAFL